MLRLLPDRPCRRREVGIGESTNCNCDLARACTGLAIYGDPAFRTKMQSEFAALLPIADVDFTWSLSMDFGLRKERVNEKRRPCSSLTFGAITYMNKNGSLLPLHAMSRSSTEQFWSCRLLPDLQIVPCDPTITRPPHKVECSSISSYALNRLQKRAPSSLSHTPESGEVLVDEEEGVEGLFHIKSDT